MVTGGGQEARQHTRQDCWGLVTLSVPYVAILSLCHHRSGLIAVGAGLGAVIYSCIPSTPGAS